MKLAEYVGMREAYLSDAHLASLHTARELERLGAELYLGRDVEGHGDRVATGYAMRRASGAELVEVL